MSTIANHELLLQLARISLCQIADALGPPLALETQIRPLAPSFRICGPACTVLCPPDDNLTLHHALHLASPGQVLVVSGSGGKAAALWGELMSISAQAKRLLGTIIDGPARDPQEIAALNYPVFARSIHPGRASKSRYGSIGETVRLGSLVVNSNDIVVADCNGIIVLPQSMLAELLEQSLAVVRKETELRDMLRAGKTYFELAGLSSLIPPFPGPAGGV
jgi:4-hydroxy-4-methyl-2-oxoglutarate aldolase